MSIPLTSAIFTRHVELDPTSGDVSINPQNMVGIFVGGLGNIVVTDFGNPDRGISGTASTYTLPAGTILPGVFTLIAQTGTTATQIKALYSGYDSQLVRG